MCELIQNGYYSMPSVMPVHYQNTHIQCVGVLYIEFAGLGCLHDKIMTTMHGSYIYVYILRTENSDF